MLARTNGGIGGARTSARHIADLSHFLLIEGGLIKSPVIVLAVLSSLSRAGLIFTINHVASNPGLNPVPLTLLAISVVATLIFSHLARVNNHAVVKRLQRDMRIDMTERLLNADVSFLQDRDHGQVYSVVTQETGEVSASALKLIEMIEAILLLAICTPYVFWMSWPTGVATVFAVTIGVIGFVLTEAPARQLIRKANNASWEFCDRVSDLLGGWMELRLRRSRRDELEAHAAELAEAARSNSVAAENLFSLGQAATQASLIILLCAIVVVLPLLQGSSTATMFQMLTLVLFTSGPIELIFGGLPKLSRAAASKRKMDEAIRDLAASRENLPAGTAELIRPRFKSIELRGVTAVLGEGSGKTNGKTRDDTFELGPVDLTFRPGETVFICGGNGAGKSTLLGLITGLRYPDRGQVLLDGVPLGAETIGQYRSLFSAVFSHFHLFRKPYGLSSQEQGALSELLPDLGLAGRISLHDGSFSTLSLSTGQKRRLALAVSLAESRPIIIFDEFAADQDPARRAFFYDVLVPHLAKAGHLVIAVTHDEHRFAQCDRLIRMEAGRVVSDTRNERPPVTDADRVWTQRPPSLETVS